MNKFIKVENRSGNIVLVNLDRVETITGGHSGAVFRFRGSHGEGSTLISRECFGKIIGLLTENDDECNP